MSKIKLVCVDCNRVDLGDGDWSSLDNPAAYDLTNALCPDCCRTRFPTFYGDQQATARSKSGVSGVWSALKKRFCQ